VQKLGGQTKWLSSTLPRLVGIVDILEKQLEKEKTARDLFKQARKVAMNNRRTVKAGGFFDRLRGRDISEMNIVPYRQLINHLDGLITDEERHARVLEDAIATFKALKQK
jgi:hypothetical protein